MKAMRKYLWIGALMFSLGFLVMGGFFVYKGLDAKGEIKARLAEQQAYTGKDAVQFGVPEGTFIDNPVAAQAQADMIKFHTLDRYGPWSTIARDAPERNTFIQGVTLQTALNMSVLAWGVADLAIGSGAMIILLGLATLTIATPALYWARVTEEELVREVRGQAYAPAFQTGAGD